MSHTLSSNVCAPMWPPPTFFPILVVQRVACVTIGVGKEDLARLLGVFFPSGEAVRQPKTADRLAPSGVRGVENHRVVGFAMIHGSADRAAMRGRRIGDEPRPSFLQLYQCPHCPRAAAIRPFVSRRVPARERIASSAASCPRLAFGLAFCCVDPGLIDEQVIVLGEAPR